jgi:hypothetical protein
MGTVAARIVELKKQIEAVRLNTDLSDAGREKRVKELQKQLADFQPQAIGALSRQADAIRREFADINTERYPAAIERAARGWDFSRLAYERDRMAADMSALQLKQGDALQAIERKYNDVMSGGDVYQQRSWSELAPSPVLAQFGNRAGGLVKRMEQDAERLRTTDEMLSIQEQSGKLALRASALKRDIKDVMPQLDYEGQIALQKAMSGIVVTERLDVTTLALETSLSVDEATPSAVGAPVGEAVAA